MDINLPCIVPFVIADSALAILIWRSRRRRPVVRIEPAGSDEPVLVIGGLARKPDRPPAGYNSNELSAGAAPVMIPRTQHKQHQSTGFVHRSAFAVNKVMADAGVGFAAYALPGSSRPEPVIGPRTLTFLLRLDRPGSLDRVLGLGDKMAMEAGVEHARIARYQHVIGVEFPLPTNRWEALALDRPGTGFHVMLGRNTLNKPVRLDLADAVHALIAGETGSGKTWLLKSIMYQLALADSDKLKLVLIDGKQSLRAFHRLPHLVAPPAVLPEDAIRQVAWVAGEILRRGNPGVDRTPLFLVIDELALLVGQDSAAVKWLKQILSLGREVDVHTIAGTQRVSAEVLGDKMLVDNFPMRLAGKVVDAEASRMATGQRQMAAEMLLGKGDFLSVHGGRTSRFVAAVASQNQIDALPHYHGDIIDVTADTTVETLAMIDAAPGKSTALPTTPAQYADTLAIWTHTGAWPGIGKIKAAHGVGPERAKRIQTQSQELAEALDRAGVILAAKETTE